MRILIILQFCLWVVAAVAAYYSGQSLPDDLIQYNKSLILGEMGKPFPILQAIFWVCVLVIYLGSSIQLFRGKSSARHFYLASCLGLVAAPFVGGPIVSPALTMGFKQLLILILGITAGVAYAQQVIQADRPNRAAP